MPPTGEVIGLEDLCDGFRGLGLRAGSGVMVHSSLSSFGHVLDGVRTVIDALMEVVTPEGTLMMPSFNHGKPFGPGGSGYYDPRETRTTNGAIPDLFWRLPDVQRSLDPTHPIAAWGKKAQRYTRGHHRTLTMGPESPLGLIGAEGGYGLLLGVDHDSNTYHHVVEMSTFAPCLGQRSEAYPVRLPDGGQALGRTWGWRSQRCPIDDEAIYREEMETQGLQKTALIGSCRATLFRLDDCYRVVAGLLASGKNGIQPCSRCPVRPRHVAQTVAPDWDAATQTLMADSIAWSY